MDSQETWVRVAPGVEVCLRPGDSPPTEVEVVAERLDLRREVERRVAYAGES